MSCCWYGCSRYFNSKILESPIIIKALAIQNDRDRIGPTKKFRMEKRNSSGEEDQISVTSSSPQQRPADDNKVIENLTGIEQLCNTLRSCVMVESKNVKETLMSPCLLYRMNTLEPDVRKIYLLKITLKSLSLFFFFLAKYSISESLSCFNGRY